MNSLRKKKKKQTINDRGDFLHLSPPFTGWHLCAYQRALNAMSAKRAMQREPNDVYHGGPLLYFFNSCTFFFFWSCNAHESRSYCLNKTPSSESPPARPRSLDSIEIQPTNHICKSELFKCGACYFAAEEGQRNGTGLALTHTHTVHFEHMLGRPRTKNINLHTRTHTVSRALPLFVRTQSIAAFLSPVWPSLWMPQIQFRAASWLSKYQTVVLFQPHVIELKLSASMSPGRHQENILPIL